ncbi:MAG TPA: tRNA lysidine(34) synthetase TilS [Candidatus Acidoferrales bacterium]|jgi:tRNA(Ile)-lysidine synthase|nr:tRNA lysidine(34) synthetase TilS [Candidatus Acidoferrales bacterium]
MLSPGDRVGVAVSGGADSVALLRLLHRFRERLGITLLVVHFDHQLRGAESDADAEFVAALARGLRLDIAIDREDVAAAAARHKWNIEDAARRLRYAFFARVTKEGKATRIAVAHTADDQAETVLAHLLRGTGPAGLAGIYPVAGAVVRPLLWCRRESLRKYLHELKQDWREDSTNRDVGRTRAKIREQLMPLLEKNFSLQVATRLGRIARLSREEEQFWSALVEDRLQELARSKDGALAINVRDLLAPIALSAGTGPYDRHKGNAESAASLRALTERLIRRLYQRVSGSAQGPTAERVEQVIRLAVESTSGRGVELPGGVRAERNFDELIFSRAGGRAKGDERPKASCAYQYSVKLPKQGETTVSVPELKRCFRLKVIDWPHAERETKAECIALDADLLRPPLILRNWRPGDVYRPQGRRQARKLKRMFLAKRIPIRERAGWPVLESGGRIVWVRGMPAADEYCAGAGTSAGIVIEERSA